MPIRDSIQTFETHARYELAGTMTFQAGVLTLKKVVECCREHKLPRLLVFAGNVQGMQTPSMGERFWFSSEIARSAMGQVCIALVARPEFIDPQKFGITVAVNRNLTVDIFTVETDALNWLLQQSPG